MYSQQKEKIKSLKRQLSQEQESSKISLAREQRRSNTLSCERRELEVVLNGTKAQHAIASTAAKIALENMREELELRKQRFDIMATSDSRRNLHMESKVLHLEAKIREQKTTIRESEAKIGEQEKTIRESLRKDQCLESKVLHLEAKIGKHEKTIKESEEKIGVQAKKITESEIVELVRKEQKQKRDASGIQKQKEKRAMEAATGVVVTKKRKRKPSSTN